MEKDLKQGTRVEYKPTSDMTLTGTICGIANTGVTFIGKGYIIELDESSRILCLNYPYTHLVGFELYLKEII